jgi:hypothetical protein
MVEGNPDNVEILASGQIKESAKGEKIKETLVLKESTNLLVDQVIPLQTNQTVKNVRLLLA